MDSSSIVCMADHVIAAGRVDASSPDTVSYYDDSEPNWNERPYFTKIEEKRGRTGFHIDVASEYSLLKQYEPGYFAATLGSAGRKMAAVDQFSAVLRSQGKRVVLSGIGGDEVLGGVPTPIPELANLVAAADVRKLAKQLVAWALVKRKPLLHLLAETITGFLPGGVALSSTPEWSAMWLGPKFTKRHRTALRGYQKRLRFFGPLPSFQENISTLDVLRRQLASSPLAWAAPHEMRYPYLDRELLEFVYAIPREQIVRPLQRRSLMRRALVGIVPDEILNRKRKAFVVRGPIVALFAEWPRLLELSEHMVSVSLGIVNRKAFAGALQKAHQGGEIHVSFMMRTLEVECWLRHVALWNLWKPSAPDTKSRARARFIQSSAS
jgi:asparagine synthase (glutamine-hydrolysing)